MPFREWRFRIEDMLKCVADIDEHTSGMTYADFHADSRTASAVAYNLAVIGEAASHIPPEIEARFPDIPWARMRGMRNILIHEYFGADPEIVWKTVQSNLPQLAVALRKVLEEDR